MNHIQWLCFDPARSSARAVSKIAILGIDETLEIVRIAHAGIMGLGRRRGRAAGAYWLRRQQPRQDVEEDHHRAGQQRQRDEAEADDGRVDAGVIGETGGDAHDLGVAAVDQETSVHFGFLWFE